MKKANLKESVIVYKEDKKKTKAKANYNWFIFQTLRKY